MRKYSVQKLFNSRGFSPIILIVIGAIILGGFFLVFSGSGRLSSTSSTQQAKDTDYNEGVKKSYMDACVARGTYKDLQTKYCECAYNYIKDHMSFQEFSNLDKQSSEEIKNNTVIKESLSSCKISLNL